MVVAVILARKGSGKNLRPLGNHPLVAYTFESARRAKALDFVVVSTDDPGISRLADDAGLTVFDRPADLAGPMVSDLPVIVHVLDELAQRGVRLWDDDLVVLLRPTAPFRREGEIDHIVALMQEWEEASSIRSVVRSPAHPRKLYREAGFQGLPYTVLLPYTPNHWANGPRQALEPVWRPCGLIDAVRVRWVRAGSCEGPLVAAYPVEPERAIDLDREIDWVAAEAYVAAQGLAP